MQDFIVLMKKLHVHIPSYPQKARFVIFLSLLDEHLHAKGGKGYIVWSFFATGNLGRQFARESFGRRL
jgi:hypothetical protein